MVTTARREFLKLISWGAASAVVAFPRRGTSAPEQTQAREKAPGAGGWQHEELRRFKAPEANQGVAVDAGFFYVKRFAGNSSSGGAFGPGGHLFVTGHDARELYVLDLPESGEELLWRATIPISAAGQAFAWDRAEAGVLYSIERGTREVIVSRIHMKP